MERRGGRRASPRPGVEPWLPLGDAAAFNVAAQRGDAGSQLHLTRDLIALRRAQPDLRGGDYATLPAPAGAWAWRRGERHVVALNLSDAEVTVEGLRGPGGRSPPTAPATARRSTAR